MEFVERVLGIKRRKQERALVEAGITGDIREELVGPEHKKAQVVRINNDQFRRLLQTRRPEEILSQVGNVSDTHVYHELYMDIGQGVKVKTGVSQIDYSKEMTLFGDLQKMGYKHHIINLYTESRPWRVDKLEETKRD